MSLVSGAATLEDSVSSTESLRAQPTLGVSPSLGTGLMLTLEPSFLAIVPLSPQLTQGNGNLYQTTNVYSSLIVPPGTLGYSYFKGSNITEFLEKYKDLYKDARLRDAQKLCHIPQYCTLPIEQYIKSLALYSDRDQKLLKKMLLEEFYKSDIY
jgi:hypothetical protein